VAITGTMNGVDVKLNLAPAASSSPTAVANSPLSPSAPTNTTSTSGDTASNCSEAAHLRNDATLAARTVWMQGRAALDLLVQAADKADRKDLRSFGKDLDAARKDAEAAIQKEWRTNVACAGKGQESDDEDTSTTTTSTTNTTVTAPASPAAATPTPATTTTTGTTTTGTTASNSVEITFDTSKLGSYATFVDDEVAAVNKALSDAASVTSTTQTSEKKHHDAKTVRGRHHEIADTEDEADDK
jgi:hypothetical protein